MSACCNLLEILSKRKSSRAGFVVHISIVQDYGNCAKHRLQRQIDLSGCCQVNVCIFRFSYNGKDMEAGVVKV